jgi:DNA-binding transcriptional ArsR family regulator
MSRPKLYTDAEAAERKRLRNAKHMASVRRAAQGLPIDAAPYSSISGERAPKAKLTLKAVRRYRKRWANGEGDSVTKLAEEAGISKSTMSEALRGLTYKE